MSTSISSKVTEGIRVNVRAIYAKDESSPAHNYFVFAYEVEIINESLYTVQLLSREWHITDGIGRRRIVEGEGVIGQQPVIRSGDRHKYVSGSHFPTPIGKMEGYYFMHREMDGAEIQVEIPPFVMATPYILN
ncbi:MAG: Co2+/Mg2+ efflux protein ApaG [Bacteroidia bacterium]|nr:Co2+/Mg2+ efflux protein ApaG [Bacteroidia bacterium]